MTKDVRVAQDLAAQLAQAKARINELEQAQDRHEQLSQENLRLHQQVEQLLGQGSAPPLDPASLKTLLKQIPAGVLVAEAPSGRIILANPEMEQMLRVTVPLGTPVQECTAWTGFHADGQPYQQRDWPLARAVLDGKMATDERIAILRPDDSCGTISVSALPLRGEDGQIFAAIAIAHDVTAQARAAEQVRQLHQRVMDIFESIRDIFVAIDHQWRFTYVNRHVAAMAGLRPEDLLGQDVWEKLPALRGGDIERNCREAMAKRTTMRFQVDDFPGRQYEINLYPTPEGLTIYGRDTTDRKQAEDALRGSEARLRLTVEVGNLATFDYFPQEGRLVWSDRAKRHFGLPPEAHVDYDVFLAGLHPDDRNRIHQTVQQAMQGEPTRSRECVDELRTIGIEDKQQRWLTTRWRVYYDSQGRAARIIGTTLDITEHKRAEEALRASEERFRTSVESMLDGFVICSAIRDPAGQIVDFRIEYINEAGCLLNRMSRDQQIGQRLRALWPQIAESGLLEECRRVVDSGVPLVRESSQYTELYGQGSPDLRRVYDLRVTRLDDGFAAVWRDMTHRKRMEQQLRDLNETLEHRVAERTAVAEHRAAQLQRLAGELSRVEEHERRRLAQILHDHLQQLLVGAKFSVSMLRGQAHDDQLRQSLRQVDDLLNDSITASRSLTVELSPPILAQGSLGAALHWLSRWMAEKHSLATEVRADEQANPQSEEIRSLLFQAVRELLLNVVKHASVKGAIVEMHATDDGFVRIVVADTGVGFDPSQIGRSQDPASGFGLFSLQERLSLLGGRMDIESAPGQGTRVTVLAPMQPGAGLLVQEAVPPAVESAEAAGRRVEVFRRRGSRGKAVRVLLADDHDVVRNGLARLLQTQPGIQVIGQASDGQMAVDLAMRMQPDVIVMDVSMPRLDGVEATRRVISQLPKVKVIGLSMHGEGEIAERMRLAGAVTYLAKSSAPEDLIAAIRACKPEAAQKQ